MSENHDSGDENDRFSCYTNCPHCGIKYMRDTGYRTPVLKPIKWKEFIAAPLTNAKSYDEVLECCGHTHCIVKDRQLAEALAEDLDYKLDQRRYKLMIEEAKERHAGV